MLLSSIHKQQQMAGSNKTEQFLHETITWKRLLDFFVQETSFLKTRLSQVVDRETDKIFIARAEQFQNEFILKDEGIDDIERDIKDQEKTLKLTFAQKKEPEQKLCKQQEKLRNEISYLEKEFNNLKTQFNKFLLSVVDC